MLQYRKILKRVPTLYEAAEKIYLELGEKISPQAVTGIYVMAPVMFGYVNWVLQEAVRLGHRKLYFLARDGYSMYQAAIRICEQKGLDIECRYLYCSRYALRGAEYSLLREESLSHICLGGIEVSFERVMYRAGLNREEAEKIALEIGYADRMDEKLSFHELRDLEPLLRNSTDFLRIMLRKSEQKYPMVAGYLKQEGLLENSSYAIVDSGWMGSMQKSINHLIQVQGYKNTIEGYYFGIYAHPALSDKGTYHAYYFEPGHSVKRKVYFSNSLFECIFSSPEGMVTGYEERDGKYCPVFEQDANPNKDRLAETTRLLCRYMQEVGAAEISRQDADRIVKVTERLLRLFMARPTFDEAAAYGKFVFCDDVIGENSQTVAASLTIEDIKGNTLFGKGVRILRRSGRSVPESAWIEGSIKLNGKAGKKDLYQAALYKYVRYLRK